MTPEPFVPAGSVLVTGRTAGFLLLASRQMRLRDRAAALPTSVRGELVATLDALERAAREYRVPTADLRNSEPPTGEPAPVSGCTTATAAGLLGLSERRVQQYAAGGLLPARRVGRSWLLDDEAVRLLARERRTA